MGNPSAAHEPSMEEILASIRQIISEDGEQAEGEAEAPEGGDAPPMSEAAEHAPAMPATAHDDESGGEQEEQAEEASEPADEPASMATAAPPAAAQPQQHRPEPTLRRQPLASQPAQPPASAEQQMRPAAASGAAQHPASQAMAGAMPASGASSAGDQRRLLSPQADASVSGAFSALAHTILAQNARTLEDLVSEMLRPMLKDWLDDNLPPLVERLVKEEIERVSRGRH